MRDYKRILQTDINQYYEDIYFEFKTSVMKYITPTSSSIEDYLTNILNALKVRAGHTSLATYNVTDNQSYSDFDVDGKLTPDFYITSPGLTEDINIRLSNLYATLYAPASNDKLNFAGKQTLHEIIVADKNSYLDYGDDIIRHLRYIEELQDEVNYFSNFACNENNYTRELRSAISDLYDELSTSPTKLDNIFRNVCRQIRRDLPEIYHESEIDSLNEKYKTIKSNQLYIHDALSTQHTSSYDSIILLGDTYENVSAIHDEIFKFNQEITNLNEDFDKVLGELEDLDMSIANINTTVSGMLKVAKDNYRYNGEMDLSELDQSSVFYKDAQFNEEASDSLAVESMIVLGLIDSKYYGEDIPLEDAYRLVNYQDYDYANAETFYELQARSPYVLENLANTLEGLQNYNIDNEVALDDPSYEVIYNLREITETIYSSPYSSALSEITLEKGTNVAEDHVLLTIEIETYEDAFETQRYEINQQTSDYSTELLEKEAKLLGQELESKEEELDDLINQLGISSLLKKKLKGRLISATGKYAGKISGFLLVASLVADFGITREEAIRIVALKIELDNHVSIIANKKEVDMEEDGHKYLSYETVYTTKQVGTNVLITSTTIVPTEDTILMLKAIDNAYIISQGSNTLGYEEAMEWAASVASRNESKSLTDDHAENMENYLVDLKAMKDLSLSDLVANYNEYKDVLYAIYDDLNMEYERD